MMELIGNLSVGVFLCEYLNLLQTSGSILSQLEEIAVKSTRSTVSPSSSTDEEKKDTVAPTRLTFTATDEVR